MTTKIDQRLQELNITLPSPAKPAGSYIQFYKAGHLLFVSGQLPARDGDIKYTGKVGDDLSLEDGQKAAELCALNIIAQAKEALDGNLDRVKRIVRLNGFVNAPTTFTDHPKVINGASDILFKIFDEKGRHTRVALGAGCLPLNVAVEIDAVIECE